MAAWISPYLQDERRRPIDDDEASRRRMVELLLGPFVASNTGHLHQLDCEQPTTLNLLPPAPPGASCPSERDNIGCTHVELEPEMPLPSGWEKCLNLKTGSIYYLYRNTGATSVSDPRKQAPLDMICSGIDASSSPTTSELTVEASTEPICNSKALKLQRFLNISEKPNSNVDGDLDLNLTLHVGLCSSPKATPSRDAGVLSLHPSNPVSPVKYKASTNGSAPGASLSSSSSTSSPVSASLAFSQTILSNKELSQQSFQDGCTFFKQENNQSMSLAMRGSSIYGGIGNSLSDYVKSLGETRTKLAESEDLSTAAMPMVTVACANCLMFVMLLRSNPRCPRCGTNCPEQMDFPQPPLKRAKLGFSF